MKASSSDATVTDADGHNHHHQNRHHPADYDRLRQQYEIHARHHISLPKKPVPKDASIATRVIWSGIAYPIALRLRGSVIPRIFVPVVMYALWAVFLALVRDWLGTSYQVKFEFSGRTMLALSLVIGMILGFRTNTAYARFREGRQVLCDIVVDLRNLKRIFARTDFSGGKKDSIQALRLLPCFFIAVKRRLRQEISGGLEDDYEGVIRDIESKVTKDIRRIPGVIIDRLFDLAADQAGLSSTPAMGHVAALSSSFTNLEKIMSTPIPGAYDIHLNQIIALYLLMFPLQMSDYWWAVPSTVFAAFTLLGVEGIGQEIEYPFGYDWNDLPLDAYVADFVEELQYAVDSVAADQRAGMGSVRELRMAPSTETGILVDIK